MHKTIEEINLGLSNLNLVVDAQSTQNLFMIFVPVYEYLNKQKTIVLTKTRPHCEEYIGRDENFLIRIVEEDKRSMLAKYCSDGKLLGTFNFFIELKDANEIDCGWSVYKFVDVTLERLKSIHINL